MTDYSQLLKVENQKLIEQFSTPTPNGVYVVAEGFNGNGKSTLVNLLYYYYKLTTNNIEIARLSEPGDMGLDTFSSDFRPIIQGDRAKIYDPRLDSMTQAYGYRFAGAQKFQYYVNPTLNANGFVFSARDLMTTIVFQGLFGGLGVEKVLNIASTYVGTSVPDLYIFPDLDAKIALARTLNVPNSKEEDFWEEMGLEFHKETRQIYQLLSEHPIFMDRWLTIDGTLPPEEVAIIAATKINKIAKIKLGIELESPSIEKIQTIYKNTTRSIK